MLGWTSGRYREVNADQLATPTDRALVGRRSQSVLLPAPTTEHYDETSTAALQHYRAKSTRPSMLACAFTFACGMVLGLVAVVWPL